MQVDQLLKDLFESMGLKYTHDTDRNSFLFGVEGKNGKYFCAVQLLESKQKLVFFVVAGTNVPKEHQPKIVELLTRINYNLVVGSFDMDLEDGEIRFRIGIDFNGLHLTKDSLERVVLTGISTMDKEFVEIMKAMYSE